MHAIAMSGVENSLSIDDQDSSSTCILKGTRLEVNPDADVSDLFQCFNKRFFWDKLKFVEVRWSPRMTLCAGLCVYQSRPGYCSIRLSRPLLSLRDKVDLVQTLLHEMIHAFLFVTENNRDRDGHGPEFLKHMYRINKEVGLNISVFHNFSDEVKHYQQHVWLCNGPCQQKPPYFGKVHRSMNRSPGPTDIWWSDHERDCGGIFSKIAEPEGFIPKNYRKKSSSDLAKEKKGSIVKSKDIRSFFKPVLSVEHKRNSITCHMTPDNKLRPEAVNQIPTEPNGSSQKIVPKENDDACENNTEVVSSDSEDDVSDSSSDENIFGIWGFFNHFRYSSKKNVKDSDLSTVKVRKPNLNSVPKSKRGMLKNLIKVPDQPTLDSFYQKKKLSAGAKSLRKSMTLPTVSLSQKKKDALKQKSVHSYWSK